MLSSSSINDIPKPLLPSTHSNASSSSSSHTSLSSLAYLHKRRYSDTANNPFVIDQDRQSQTNSNTEQNKTVYLNSFQLPTLQLQPPSRYQSQPQSQSLWQSRSLSPEERRHSLLGDYPDSSSRTTSSANVNDLPPLIRKKSGEVVKSSLKLSSLGRSAQSLPTTPTYKSVHFNNKSFVDVKYFNEKDIPTAISAETSPTIRPRRLSRQLPKYRWLIGDSDSELDSGSDDDEYDEETDNENDYTQEYSNIDWNIQLNNFNNVDYQPTFKANPPVFLERIFLSQDKKFLKGHIAAKNLAFEKRVSIKYSLNNWKIISEVDAHYVPDIPRLLRKNDYDRFVFKIPLVALIEDKVTANRINIAVCIKYDTQGTLYWDNNSFKNYEFSLVSNSQEHRDRTYTRNRGRDHYPNNSKKYSSKYLTRTHSLDGIENLKLDDNFGKDNNHIQEVYNKYSDSSDSYFPPFESLSPSTPDFKYSSTNAPSTATRDDASTPPDIKEELGPSLVDFKHPGFGAFYSTGPSANTAENLAFENDNIQRLDDNEPSSPTSGVVKVGDKEVDIDGSAKAPLKPVMPGSFLNDGNPSEPPSSANTNAENGNLKSGLSSSLYASPYYSNYENGGISNGGINNSVNGNRGHFYNDTKHHVDYATEPSSAKLANQYKENQNSNNSTSNSADEKTLINGNCTSGNENYNDSDRKYSTNEIQKLQNERPAINSKSYQELVKNYCFFQG